jgi:hypothetical protein
LAAAQRECILLAKYPFAKNLPALSSRTSSVVTNLLFAVNLLFATNLLFVTNFLFVKN